MTAAAFFPCPVTSPTTELVPGRRRRFWLPSAAVLIAAVAPAVHAEAGNPLNDRFSVSLGTFLLSTSTELRVDGAIQGTEIDTERDLGIKDSDRFRLDAYWRMTPRQKLRLMYFDTSSNASKVLERDIIFNDQLYQASLEIKARSQTQVTELAYEFDFMQRDNYEIGFTAGIHNLSFKTGISATGGGQGVSADSNASADGPLPVLGLRGVWRFGDKFYMDAAVQYFSISFDPYDGSLTDYGASFAWQATNHFALGVGYNEFVTKVDVSGDKFTGHLRWQYGGGRIFVTASF